MGRACGASAVGVVKGEFGSRVGGMVTDNDARVGVGPGVRVGVEVAVAFPNGVVVN